MCGKSLTPPANFKISSMLLFFKNHILLCFVIATVIITVAIFMTNHASKPLVRINSVEIPVEVVRDEASRQKGLSGRPSLDAKSGMLFIFDKPAIYTFWMPGMNFPIDIIWINNGKVIDISANVPNNFDPNNPYFYAPSQPAQYVLEVNAGFSEKKNINIGDPVSLINIK
jgi:uncharacterized membrane protein (UPF0127 family)